MEDNRDAELRSIKKKIKGLLVFCAVCLVVVLFSTVLALTELFSNSSQEQEIQRWNKTMECQDKSMCIKMLDNGDFECCDCKEVQP